MNDGKVNVPLDEVIRVFDLLESLQDFMHEPVNYSDVSRVDDFVNRSYAEVRELYYSVVGSWLPEHTRAQIEKR